MINIAPIPKFADDHWEILMKNFPETWSLIIHHAIVWTLSQERRYRDCRIFLEIINISSGTMRKLIDLDKDIVIKNTLSIDNETLKVSIEQFYIEPDQKFPEVTRYYDNNLGRIYCCSDAIYSYITENDLDKFAYLVRFGMEIALKLQKKKPARFYKQTIMSKFGLVY